MAKQPFDSLIGDALTCAENAVLAKGQTYINTAALFDGVLRTFARKQECAKLSADVKKIFGKYGINSQVFNNAYCEIFPVSESLPRTVDVMLEEDATNALDSVVLKAQQEQSVQSIDSLLAQLFSNKTYKLFLVFTRISDTMGETYQSAVDAGVEEKDLPPVGFDVNLLYADMISLLTKSSVKEVKSLETDEMKKYLTNINKYVESKSDFKLVGMKNELTALEIALAGRTKKSAVLTGKAGTGKTSLVYELANRINKNDVPELLKGTIIYELHMDALVAGEKY